MPENPEKRQANPLQNKAHKDVLLKRGSYLVMSNELADAYLSGNISGHCFKLVIACLRHNETFHLKDAYLLPKFSNDRRSLRKAQAEATARGIITINKVRQGSSFINHYIVHDISEWRLELEFTGGDSHTWENPHVGIPTRGNIHPLKKINDKNKNKRIKKNDDDEESELESASSSCEENWLCDYEPGALVDALKSLKVLWGFTDFRKWNRIVEELWIGKTQEQVELEISVLSKWAGDGKRRPPPNAVKIRSLLNEIGMTYL